MAKAKDKKQPSDTPKKSRGRPAKQQPDEPKPPPAQDITSKRIGGIRALARELNVDPAQVSRAYKDKKIASVSFNAAGFPQFDIDAAAVEFRNNVAVKGGGRHDPKYGGDLERYNRARADKEEANASIARLDLAARKGDMVFASAVGLGWTQTVKSATQKLMAIPQKVFMNYPELTNAGKDFLTELLRQTLDDISKFEPELDNFEVVDVVEDEADSGE